MYTLLLRWYTFINFGQFQIGKMKIHENISNFLEKNPQIFNPMEFDKHVPAIVHYIRTLVSEVT